MWEDLAFYPKGRNALEYLKKRLSYHSALVAAQESRLPRETQTSKDPARELAGRNKDSVSDWAGKRVAYILTKNLATFCPCPENLSEIKFKSSELTYLVEEIQRQDNIQPMAWLFTTHG